MEKPSFESLMSRHEMGKAYKVITSQMGPCPQLLAFINYDKVTEDSVGLESFDIMSQHEQTLIAIANDDSFELAIESLATDLRKIVGFTMVAVGAMGAKIDIHDQRFAGGSTISKIGIHAVALILGGALMAVSGVVGDIVITTKRFDQLTREFDASLKIASLFAASVPSTTDEKAWENFHKNFVANNLVKSFWQRIKDKIVGEVENRSGVQINEKKEGTALFMSSGWTVEEFEKATKWLVDADHQIKEVGSKIGHKLEGVVKQLERSGRDSGKTPHYVSETMKIMSKVSNSSRNILIETEKGLAKVSHHFVKKD